MLFKFKYDNEIYTLVKITGEDTKMEVIAFNINGNVKIFDRYDLSYRIKFLDPEISSSPLYAAMNEK